jgi:hypothetical protein
VHVDVHHDRGVGQPKALGEDDSGLRCPLIVGLEAGQHEIELFVSHGVGERGGDDRRIRRSRGEAIVLDMNGPVGTARQRFAQHLRRARWPGRADNDVAAMLLTQTKRLFECVRVRLVHLEAGILLTNAAPGLVDARLPLAGRNLLDAHGYLHDSRMGRFED